MRNAETIAPGDAGRRGHRPLQNAPRRTLERDLCPDCEQTLRESGLTFSKVTRCGDPPLRCAWCRRKRLTGRVKIAYGRK